MQRWPIIALPIASNRQFHGAGARSLLILPAMPLDQNDTGKLIFGSSFQLVTVCTHRYRTEPSNECPVLALFDVRRDAAICPESEHKPTLRGHRECVAIDPTATLAARP